MSKMSEHRNGESGWPTRGKTSPVPNTKFKALVLIPSRMDSVGGQCVRVRTRVCLCVCTVEIFGNHKTKLGGVR